MIVMAGLRILSTFAKWLAFELVALLGAVAYVLLSNALPEIGGQVLAALILLPIVTAIGYRLVGVLRDPVGAAQRRSKK
jgi:drug/metabolite transporter (DMT)-like permease